ncbi:outer membrane beta-barrel protein [Trinickia caryophylli]|nr:outer membrane beta-barrel protein [Trinickia caryophylli]WQE10367.1 outer membrane beta-barrel protein [Trinickia caryophylli]GLU34183.1 hypothetical protein Busp01_40250 [Trinickia caryophylli]
MTKFSIAALLGIAWSAAFGSPGEPSETNWGFYVGVAPSYTSIDHQGAMAYVGHRGLAYGDILRVGAEFQLASFGVAPITDEHGTTHRINTYSSSASTVIAFDIGRFQFFTKLGVAKMTTLPTAFSANPKEKFYETFGPSLGLGAAFKVTEHLAARIEWHQDFSIGQQAFDGGKGSRNPGMLAAGLRFMF